MKWALKSSPLKISEYPFLLNKFLYTLRLLYHYHHQKRNTIQLQDTSLNKEELRAIYSIYKSIQHRITRWAYRIHCN